MMKLRHNPEFKITEIDPSKTYVLTVPEQIGLEQFNEIVSEIKSLGVSNFITIHEASGFKLDELRQIPNITNRTDQT
jgi:hypothetical protein